MNGNPNEWERASLPWYGWAAVAAVLLAQGTWLFIDARQRGKFPWFWGVWGLLQFPLPLVVYIVFVRLGFRFGRAADKWKFGRARKTTSHSEHEEESP